MPVDVGNEKTKKKDKQQKENIEEFVTPKKRAKTSNDSARPVNVNGSSLSKKKRKRQNSTSGPGVQPEQNGTLANGTAEETTTPTTEKSPNTNADTSQSHKKSSAKKRRKSKAGDNSLVMSSELSNGSVANEADSSLHELTKKRRSLATLVGEQDTRGSAQKEKKKKINSAAWNGRIVEAYISDFWLSMHKHSAFMMQYCAVSENHIYICDTEIGEKNVVYQ